MEARQRQLSAFYHPSQTKQNYKVPFVFTMNLRSSKLSPNNVKPDDIWCDFAGSGRWEGDYKA